MPWWYDGRIRGIMGCGCALKANQITDGLAHTILLGEIRAGLDTYDTRGVWAMSGACPSSLWACGYLGGDDDYGPNCLTPAADDMVNCSQLQTAYGGGPDGLIAAWMPCSVGDWPNWQQTVRSMHVGGVYVALADGGVHFISDDIDVTDNDTASISNPSIWNRLISSGDGQTIPASVY
jgi:hypothetical protein